MINYKDYGGKGIKICQTWLDDFINFYNWAIQNGYQDNLTIERKDNSKDYCPENCTWIPRNEQPKNQKSNIKVTIFGETKLASEWTKDERCEVSRVTFYQRLKRGISPENALKLSLNNRKEF